MYLFRNTVINVMVMRPRVIINIGKNVDYASMSNIWCIKLKINKLYSSKFLFIYECFMLNNISDFTCIHVSSNCFRNNTTNGCAPELPTLPEHISLLVSFLCSKLSTIVFHFVVGFFVINVCPSNYGFRLPL